MKVERVLITYLLYYEFDYLYWFTIFGDHFNFTMQYQVKMLYVCTDLIELKVSFYIFIYYYCVVVVDVYFVMT